MRQSPLGARTTLYGRRLISSADSSNLRPIRRLTEYTVFSALVMAWRRATTPTMRSPSLPKPTTEGVVRAPPR